MDDTNSIQLGKKKKSDYFTATNGIHQGSIALLILFCVCEQFGSDVGIFYNVNKTIHIMQTTKTKANGYHKEVSVEGFAVTVSLLWIRSMAP